MAIQDPRLVSGFSKNVVVGSGYLFFDEIDASGNHLGELYLAETPGFALAVTTDTLEDYDADGPIAELNFDHPISVKRTATVGVKDMSTDVLSLFVIGDKSTQTTSGGTVTDKAINGGVGVQQGYWYQLGVDTTYPAGVREISSVTIETPVPVAYTITTDYLLDAELGRIYIVPGGGIANDTIIQSDYTEGSVSWDEVGSNDLGAKSGALRYVAHNSRGTNRDLLMTSVVMAPNGDLAFKSRDTVQQGSFTVSVGLPGDGRSALYINGRAA